MGKSSYVHIEVDEIRRETNKAFLLLIGDEEVWIPKACITDPDDYKEGDKDCSMSITESIAREKGLGE